MIEAFTIMASRFPSSGRRLFDETIVLERKLCDTIVLDDTIVEKTDEEEENEFDVTSIKSEEFDFETSFDDTLEENNARLQPDQSPETPENERTWNAGLAGFQEGRTSTPLDMQETVKVFKINSKEKNRNRIFLVNCCIQCFALLT